MDNKFKEVCDCTIKNYRYATQNLRYDGDYINHFSALINGYYERCIPYNEVKEIRKYIKNNTSKMSAFRGDILYIVSFLIALNKEDKFEFCDKIIETIDLLIHEGFKECGHLVLVAYSIVKYSDYRDISKIIKKTKYIFTLIKKKYHNLTKEDDYLLCTLLALNGTDLDVMTDYMDYTFNYIHDLNILSNNGIQCLTNSILLNNDEHTTDRVFNLLKELEENDVKIGNQFLQLLGVMVSGQDTNQCIKDIKDIIEYMCEEESEYDFYIDKDFRNMIPFVIVFMENNSHKLRYIDEMLAFGTYSFLLSKNQGIINQVFA